MWPHYHHRCQVPSQRRPVSLERATSPPNSCTGHTHYPADTTLPPTNILQAEAITADYVDEMETQADAGFLPQDFYEDMLNEEAWGTQIAAWHVAVQPMLAACEISHPSELQDEDLLELAAANARPGAGGWGAVYADYAEGFEEQR